MLLTTATAWADPTGNWADEGNRATTVPQSEDGSTLYISTAEQLACYAYGVNNDWETTGSASGYYCGRTVELMADIDLSAHYWKPIGWNKYYYFNGYFHGNGHVITGVHVNGDPKTDDARNYPCYGLFGYLHTRSGGTSTITDLVLKDFSITASYSGNNKDEFYLGGLVGRCDDNTAITNCLLVNGSVGKSVVNSWAHIGKVAGGGSPSTATANYYHNVSVSGWIDGNESYAQQTIGGETEARAVALTISGTHGSVALGGTVGRISGGIIYAPANETVTLNTTTDAGYIASLAATGLTLTSGQFTMPDNDDGAITATISIDPAHFSVNNAGTEYTIHSATGWGLFCDALQDNDTWNRFSGKTVKLGADIEVSRMAGGQAHDFCGTFDGGGHTLTFNYGESGEPASNEYAAPFSYVSNTKANTSDTNNSPATIKNLHVTGDIYTKAKYAAGIVGEHWGTLNIENCRSSIVIHSSVINDKGNDGTHGGIEAVSSGDLYITGCVFDGKLLTTNGTTNCGGFVGWRAAETIYITNSLYAPNVVEGDAWVSADGSSTFARNGDNNTIITNSYYTHTLGTAQGKHPRTVTAGDNVTIEAVSLTGSTTTYDVSGITAHSKNSSFGGGLSYGDNLYYGSGDIVTVTLSNTATGAPTGYYYNRYTASGGTFERIDDDDCKLTMPDADVTVSVNTAAPSSDGQQHEVSYVDANGTPQEPILAIALDGSESSLDAGTYFVGLENITYDHTLTLNGNVNLILCDGCTMNMGTEENRLKVQGINGSNYDLDIYSQSHGNYMGKLSIYTTDANNRGINTAAITVNGGNVIANATGSYALFAFGDITINGGNVTATTNYTHTDAIFAKGNFNFNGGTVSATATATSNYYGIRANGTITLGWTNYSDRITASSYYSTNGTVSVKSGQTLGCGIAGTKTNISGTAGTDFTLADINGKELTPSVPYLDENGDTQYCPNYTVISSGVKPPALAAGWYVVSGTVSYDTCINLTGDVTLILADGAMMNIGTSENRVSPKYMHGIDGYYNFETYSLTITSESNGDNMGTLGIYTAGNDELGISAISAETVTINGGNVIASTTGYNAHAIMVGYMCDITINGGNVTATATGDDADALHSGGNVTINGGTVNATGTEYAIRAWNNFTYNGGIVNAVATYDNALFSYDGNYIFKWTSPDDSFTIGATGLYVAPYDPDPDPNDPTPNDYTATFSRLFTDGDGNYYDGTLTGPDAIVTLAGKTLTPAIPSEGYYLVGTMTDWSISPKYKLIQNPENENELMIQNVPLTTTTQFKVVYSANGMAMTTWYPDNGGNYGEYGEITADGIYDIYFRPDYGGGMDWFFGCIYAADVSTVEVTFAPAGFCTYYHGKFDVKLPEGVKARIVTREGYREGVLIYKTIADGDTDNNKVVPAGTAVMLQTAKSTEAQQKTLTLSAPSAAAISETNLLHGSDNGGKTFGTGKHYKLTYGNDNTPNADVFGWYWGAANGAAFTSPAHKAWLLLPYDLAGARSFLALPDDDETTSIIENGKLKIENSNSDAWYDLSGRKLDNGQRSMVNGQWSKGVYIHNGRKVVIK